MFSDKPMIDYNRRQIGCAFSVMIIDNEIYNRLPRKMLFEVNISFFVDGIFINQIQY